MEKKKIVLRIWTVALVVLAAVAVIIPVMSICTGAFEPNMTSVEMIENSYDTMYNLSSGRTILSYCANTRVSVDENAQTYKVIRSYSDYEELMGVISSLPDESFVGSIQEHLSDSEMFNADFFRCNDLILVEQQVYELTELEEIYCDDGVLHITFLHYTRPTTRSQLYMIPVSDSVSASIDKLEVSFYTTRN